ncbi:MAG TPA: hypothetical protein VJJ82_05985 [Candidatus Nanoarchaeia archaeon]|nr:hypothetical protein [Candidatus Nanoarchaeia archaeon]
MDFQKEVKVEPAGNKVTVQFWTGSCHDADRDFRAVGYRFLSYSVRMAAAIAMKMMIGGKQASQDVVTKIEFEDKDAKSDFFWITKVIRFGDC